MLNSLINIRNVRINEPNLKYFIIFSILSNSSSSFLGKLILNERIVKDNEIAKEKDIIVIDIALSL